MLIRTQNKKTIINMSNVADIGLSEDENAIEVYAGNVTYKIGEYSTLEKVMKVLDMVQEQYADFSAGIGSYRRKAAVFQVPEDDEVEV